MGTRAAPGSIFVEPTEFLRSFDRVPFGFDHSFSELDIFEFDSIRHLAAKYQRDHFVAAGAPSGGAEFYSVARLCERPAEALEKLDDSSCRVLLKRPENYDSRFRRLLDDVFERIVDLRGGLGGERVLRLESAVFITSPGTLTPFHFDPEIGFFSQIAGTKIYHVYAPIALTEPDLERFYINGEINIGQVELAKRNPEHEHVFTLGPGKGLHQPQDAPHWVETGAERSISYSIVFETDRTRARSRARACNHYLRKFGIQPAPPGSHPRTDAWKAASMKWVIPARSQARHLLKRLLRR